MGKKTGDWNHQLAYQEHSYTVPSRGMRWRKRDGSHSPPKHNLIQDSEGNEENGYPVLDSNKIKTYDTKEPNDVYKNNLKEEIPQVITENFIDMILDMVNQNM
jgi:hypothetical protein